MHLLLLLQPLGLSILTIWLSWKQKSIKIIASYAAENNGQERGYTVVGRSKLLNYVQRGIQKGQYPNT